MVDLIVFVILATIAFISGTTLEKRHYKRIREREAALLHQPYVVDKFNAHDSDVRELIFVDGSCVIAADKFKMMLGGLLSFFGGRISAFETLTDRARREAILRMREKAVDADMIVCTRISFSEINPAQVEAIAYGTAVYLNK